jgi:hypothetical protein
LQADAELLELDRYAAIDAAGLLNGNGEFTAGKEARGLARDGGQIGLSQDGHQSLIGERIDHGIDVGA